VFASWEERALSSKEETNFSSLRRDILELGVLDMSLCEEPCLMGEVNIEGGFTNIFWL
jgi:hypothetical protein